MIYKHLASLIFFLSLLIGPEFLFAQYRLVNNSGSQLVVAAGTEVYVEGSVGNLGTIVNNGTISLENNWANSGTALVGSEVHFVGTGSSQQVSGTTRFEDAILDGSAGVSQSSGITEILNSLQLKVGNWNVNGNTLTLLSLPSGTAYLDDFSASYTGTISGNITQQRYIASPGGSSIHYIGSPVNGANISSQLTELNFAGATAGQIIPLGSCDPDEIDPSSPYGVMFEWNEAGPFAYAPCTQDGWYSITGGTMTSGKGYATYITGGTTLDISGPANSGTINNGPLNNSNATGDGWQVVSNPFPSPILWSGASGFDNQIQVWETSGAYSGTYQAYLPGDNKNLGAMQAFMARVSSGSATFSLDNSDRNTGDPTFYSLASAYENLLSIEVSGGGFADRTRIYFDEDATSGWDTEFDANKRMSRSGQPTLYTLTGDIKTGINGQPSLESVFMIPLGLAPGQDGTFTLTASGLENYPPSSMIFLEDLKEGSIRLLNADPVYEISAAVEDDPNRFILHFIPPAMVETTTRSCDIADGAIDLDLGDHTLGIDVFQWDLLELYDSEANLLFTEENANGSFDFDGLETGIYTLNLHYQDYVSSQEIEVDGLQQVFTDFVPSAEMTDVGQEVVFENTSLGASNYQWDFGDGSYSSSAGDVTHVYDTPGIYNCKLWAENTDGCSDEKERTISVNSSTGIEEVDNDWANIYGFGNSVYIDLQSIKIGNAQVRVFDLLGRETLSAEYSNTGLYELNMETNGSYYFVWIRIDNQTLTRKVFLNQGY